MNEVVLIKTDVPTAPEKQVLPEFGSDDRSALVLLIGILVFFAYSFVDKRPRLKRVLKRYLLPVKLREKK